jgi:HD-like signal output (HDOD) protein
MLSAAFNRIGSGERVTKVRSQLAAAEVETVLAEIDRRMDSIGIESRPAVAMRMLELVGDDTAGLNDFAEALKPDVAMTGRLLKIANSAYFGQRQPVTTLERACVILGLERIRAVGLGFYLSRSAASDDKLSRVVWGQSVLRAALASELAGAIRSPLGAEAFVVGLMMDAGLPLLRRMVGAEAFDTVYSADTPPTRQFRREMDSLPFTRDDVVVALCRRWQMPQTLALPLAWRHTPPGDVKRNEPEHVLHRIAYYAGAVHLGPGGKPREALPLPALAARYLGLDHTQLEAVFTRAIEEYTVTEELFRQVAERIGDLDALAQTVHVRLSSAIDNMAVASITDGVSRGPHRFQLDSAAVEFDRDVNHPGWVVAFLIDSQGQRVVTHRFEGGSASAEAVLDALAIDPAEAAPPILESIRVCMARLAA